MTHTIERPADRDEWLDLRHGFWNASAAACLFHDHPFLTLGEVVRAKLEPRAPDIENAAMRRGRHLEAAIAGWWEEEHGIALYEPEVMYANGALLATLDRRIVGSDLQAVEIKTTAKHVNGVERYWWWQVQAQMHCAGLTLIHVVVLDASLSLSSYPVERDPEAIERLVCAAEDIMAWVRAGRWPSWVLAEPPQRHSDRVTELDPAGVGVFERWLAAREQRTEAEQLEEAAKRELTAILGDAQAATVDGAQVLTYRSHTRTSIDLTRLRKEHAELAAELSEESVVRVLRPTKR